MHDHGAITEPMNDESDRTFVGGNRNPEKYGWSLRACNGELASPEQIARAAQVLGRESFHVDAAGYECEIIAAAVHGDGKRVVYVETRAKDKGRHVDIAIKIHYRDGAGHDHAVDIESYNPFFGCDVALLEWFDDNVAILVYREKHWTFVYRVGDRWPPAFVKIEDRWQIKDAVLSYRAYQADSVNRLSIPSLEPLASVTNAEAESLGQMPPDPYAN